jgi:hypothetical protein
MTTAGALFMALSWTAILAFNALCLRRLMAGASDCHDDDRPVANANAKHR